MTEARLKEQLAKWGDKAKNLAKLMEWLFWAGMMFAAAFVVATVIVR